MSVTAELVRELFDYQPDGTLVRRVRRGARGALGQTVGYLNNTGYLSVRIQERHYKIHRLVWLWHHGRWPKMIDHINRVKTDNRIENLREAQNNSESAQNRGVFRNNKCGYTGVFQTRAGRYRAHIYCQRRRYHLGTFATALDAAQAYWEAKRRLHQFHPDPVI